MKALILLLAITAFAGCHSYKEIQVQMVGVRLIRVDTMNRYGNNHIQQILTWKDDNDLEYVSYESLNSNFSLGARMLVLKTR